MNRIGQRDASALAQLYDRYAGLVFSLGMKILHNRSEADELLADVFLEIWQRSERYSPARGTPRGYLILLSRSRAIDRLRSRKVEVHITPLTSRAAAASITLESAEERENVVKALNVLDAGQRKMIEYSFFEGLTHSQIAEKTGQPLGTVKTSIRRGLQRLRERLKGRED